MFCVMFVVCMVCLYLWLNLAYQISWQINFYPDLNITHIFHSSFNHISILFCMYHSQKISNCLQNPIYLFFVITITCFDCYVSDRIWEYVSFLLAFIFLSYINSFLYHFINQNSFIMWLKLQVFYQFIWISISYYTSNFTYWISFTVYKLHYLLHFHSNLS